MSLTILSRHRSELLRRRRQLVAQQLESRRVLATFTVDFLNDVAGGTCGADNPGGNVDCSLRSAIAAADANPGPDRIEIQPGTYLINPAPQNGLVVQQPEDLVFAGLGATPAEVVIDGQSQNRVFGLQGLSTPHTIQFENLTIQHGISSDAGGGGGVSAFSDTSLVLRSVVMQDNQAVIDNSSVIPRRTSGGAINTSGNLDIADSNFLRNSATRNGGAINATSLSATRTVSIVDSVISNSVTGDAAIDLGEGAGVFISGDIDATFQDVVIHNNDAGGSGGGIYFDGAQLTVNNGTFTDNDALASDSGGGGLYVLSASQFSVIGGSFANNTAVAGAGGFESVDTPGGVDGTSFVGNQASGMGTGFDSGGGAIAVINTQPNAAPVSLANLTVDGNSAPNAGGIALVNARVTISDSLITNNRAVASIALTGSAGGIGAISDTGIDPLIIQRSQLLQNVADSDAGGLGTIDVSVELSETEVISNDAGNGQAGGIRVAGTLLSPTLTASSSTIARNASSGDGGGIALDEAGLSLTNVTVAENLAGANGGGIAYNRSTVTANSLIQFSTVSGNTAANGSNIAASGTPIDLLASIFAFGDAFANPGTLVSQGFNIDTDNTFGLNAAGDQINTDPLLGELLSNGGFVQTISFDPASPAIDVVNSPLVISPGTDARGVTRPQDGNGDSLSFPDVGAFELNALASSLSIADVAISETDATATISVMLDNATGSAFTVMAFTTDDTALAGSDYSTTNATLSFLGTAGEVQTFSVPITNDTDVELQESFGIAMTTASLATVNTSDTATVTITSEDLARLSVADVAVGEGDGNAIVQIQLLDAVPAGFTVDATTTGIAPASSPEDFTQTTSTLSFAALGDIQTLTVPITDDGVVELSEQIQVGLSAASQTFVDVTATGLITITDDDVARLSVTSVTVSEGDGNATVQVELLDAIPVGFTVDAVTTGIAPASSPEDFTQTTSTLSFAALGDIQTLTVPITDDGVVELSEQIQVGLSAASQTFVDVTATGLITITDDDVARLSVTSVTVNEGDGNATVQVELLDAIPVGFTVDAVTTGIAPASSPEDFTQTTSTLSFAALGDVQTLTVPITDDGVVELSEQIQVGLSAASQTFVDVTATGLITITDDDVARLSVTSVTVNEGGGNATVQVQLLDAIPMGFTVDAVTTGIAPASSPEDFTQTTSTLSFAALGDVQTLTVPITDDGVVELDEQIQVGLSAASQTFVDVTATGLITITDDDVARLSVTSVTVSEGDGNATVQVELLDAIPVGFAVDAVTTGIAPASSPEDFTQTTSTLSFAALGDIQTLTVPITDDGVVELSEQIQVGLSAASQTFVDVTATGLITITDDDVARLSVTSVTVNEGGGNATVQVQLLDAIPMGFMVDAVTTGIAPASSPEDFTQTTSTLSFAALGDVQTLTVPITDDGVVELDEQIQVGLSAASQTFVDVTATGLITIIDDDQFRSDLQTVVTVVGSTTPQEGDAVTFLVTVTNQGPATATSVSLIGLLPSGLTATANHGVVSSGQYTAATGVWEIATIAPGVSETLTLQGIADLGQAGNTITSTVTEASTTNQNDPSGVGDVLTASVTVGGGIALNPDVFAINEDESDPASSEIDPLANDTPAGLTIVSVVGASLGTATITQSGQRLQYVPDPDAFGQDVFTYTAQDAIGRTATVELTVTINAVNDPPIANDDSFDIVASGTIVLSSSDLTANDAAGPTNETAQTLTVASVSPVSNEGATVSLQGGVISVTPDPDFVGTTDAFEYTLSDGLATTTATASLLFMRNLRGHVFCDANGNGIQDTGEAVAGTRVFIDDNDNRVFDTNELAAITNSVGDYAFFLVPTGPASVIAETPPGCRSIPTNPGLIRTTLDVGNLARSITATDRDGDGDQDLVVAVDLDDSLIVLENNGQGTIASRSVIPIGVRPQAVVAETMDGGNLPTIAVAAIGQSTDGGRVYFGNQQFENMEADNGPVDLKLTNFDSDGHFEILSAAFRSSTLLLQELDGGTKMAIDTETQQIYSLDTGDVDGDGDQDIVVAGIGYRAGSKLNVLLNTGGFNFLSPISSSDALDLSNEYVDIAAVDVDGDDIDEILTLDQNGHLRTLSLDGETVELMHTTEVIDMPSQFAFGDFDNDQVLDVAIASAASGVVELLLGDGLGQFTSIKQVDSVSTPVDLTIVDLEGDGFGEIAVLSLYGDNPGQVNTLPSTVTILKLDVEEASVVVVEDLLSLDFAFPGVDPLKRLDVNDDGDVSMLDALNVINFLAKEGEAEAEQVVALRQSTDVNIDGKTTALDALMVINHMSRSQETSTASEAESAVGLLQDERTDWDWRLVDQAFESQLF